MTVYRNNPLLMTVMGANPPRRVRANSHLEGSPCSMCGGPLMFLGQLGNLEWYKCRNCGMEFSTSAVRGNPGLGAAVMAGVAGAVTTRMLSNPPIQVPGDLEAACRAVLRWKGNWAARPYAEAILQGNTGFDDPKSVLLYLRNNLSQWKGTEARIVKQVIDKYVKQGLSTFQNNMPASNAWDRMTRRVREKTLIIVGFPEEYAYGLSTKSWSQLSEAAKRAITNSWKANPSRNPAKKGPQCPQCGSKDTGEEQKGEWYCYDCGNQWPQKRSSYRPNPSTRRATRKTTMSIARFAALVKKQGDPALWRDFVAKCRAYHKWSHGSWPTKVSVERVAKPGMKGLWITFDMGKQPESTYIMPKGSKRKGAWKHPWERMPQMRGDPQAGMIITKLGGGNRLTNFLHG